MEKYVPDIYQKSIYSIDYQKLLNRGIKCILMDLDNTLVAPSIKTPNKKVKNLFQELKDMGFRIIIFSNGSAHRVKPFGEELKVDVICRAFKPSPKKFQYVLTEYHYNESEVAIIGDQLLTDIRGGNRVGITTIFVNQVSPHDEFWTKWNRRRERRILHKLRDKGLFTKGKYYE